MTDTTLEGRIVLITGARLVLLGRSQHKLEAVYDRIAQRGLPLPFLCPLDLATADAATFERLAASLAEEFAALHGLLHAAAERGTPGPVADIDPAEWDRVLRVNLDAPFLLTRALLPLLTAHAGAVLFVTDRTGASPAFRGAYGVAKQGVETLAHTLAAEWATAGRLRVNILSPSPFLSPLRRRAYPAECPDTLARAERFAAPIAEILDPACPIHGKIFSLPPDT
jgi:NAD(P)-dependent dehydrogenase (short-subunit alcohol dehydrogenase family)